MARRTRSSVILISSFVFILERMYYFSTRNGTKLSVKGYESGHLPFIGRYHILAGMQEPVLGGRFKI